MLSTLQLISLYLCDILTKRFYIACWEENLLVFLQDFYILEYLDPEL